MVGYSTKLAVTTTLTSLVFSGLARVPHPEVSVLVAAPFVVLVVGSAAACPGLVDRPGAAGHAS